MKIEDLPHDQKELLERAAEALDNSYAPYSDFKIGAALRTTSGEIYTGCNIENASLGLTNCAERTALFKAVSEGVREFDMLALTVDSGTDIIFPCGACRQVLREFGRNLLVIASDANGETERVLLRELLPKNFGPEDVDE